jgi:hypothetical protein
MLAPILEVSHVDCIEQSRKQEREGTGGRGSINEWENAISEGTMN